MPDMRRWLRLAVLGGVVVAIAGVALQAESREQARRAAEAHRPLAVSSQRYVSSNECRSCHPREYASWSSSYHRSMTQLATPETVVGNFDGVTLGSAPVYALGRSARSFYVDIAATPGAAPERKPITLVTGSHHMQIYWYETGHDRSLGQLPWVYLKDDRRWVPRNAIFIEPPDALKPAAEGRWNASCIACHTTLGQPRIDASGKFDTQVAEFGIACEACHGPGAEHVARNQSPIERYLRRVKGGGDQAIVQPKKLTHERSSYVCGQCHGTWLYDSPASMRDWNEHGPAFRPGNDPPSTVWLLQLSQAAVDPRVASTLMRDASYVEGQFWSDGVMRVSGREFNGMVDSPCYERGELACTSCHDMHQHDGDARAATSWRVAQLNADKLGDRGCLQCHRDYAQDLERHTHHAATSEGSRCYNCHMPYTSYGLLKGIRSHRIGVPNVTETVMAGRPNACNLCHLDKTLQWTAKQLRERYGVESPPLEGDDAAVPVGILLGLRGDAGQRALIAWALGWQGAKQASRDAAEPQLLSVLLHDPYDAVRYIAAHAERARAVAGPDYDYLQRPDGAAHELPGASPEQRALFERLLGQRDHRPVRLLE